MWGPQEWHCGEESHPYHLPASFSAQPATTANYCRTITEDCARSDGVDSGPAPLFKMCAGDAVHRLSSQPSPEHGLHEAIGKRPVKWTMMIFPGKSPGAERLGTNLRCSQKRLHSGRSGGICRYIIVMGSLFTLNDDSAGIKYPYPQLVTSSQPVCLSSFFLGSSKPFIHHGEAHS